MEQKILTVGFVNNVQIQIYENDSKLVPIKPICEAMDIDPDSQRKRINEDPILGSVAVLNPSTGKDGKTYQMQCLPIKYVFGWLFRIDSRNVKEEARETLIKYQMQCYDILYDYFAGYADFVEKKQQRIEYYLSKLDDARVKFSTARDYMNGVKEELNSTRKMNYQDYKDGIGQMGIFDEEETEQTRTS